MRARSLQPVTDLAPTAHWEPGYAPRADRMRASEIRELLSVLDRPGIVSFAGGIPDPALFPRLAAQQAFAAVLGDAAHARVGLQYSRSEGYPPLRQWIAGHMQRLGIAGGEDNVVITSGSQQGLEFLARLLRRAATPHWSPHRPISGRCRHSPHANRATTCWRTSRAIAPGSRMRTQRAPGADG
jgi:DNA-binding transcriptional MocR family regulator